MQNILVNIENISQKYFGTFLRDKRITRYVDTPEEFVQIITFQRLNRDTMRELNCDIIATGYRRDIEKFIN